ncbi:Uncharacterized protein TCM_044325 [Theobroma cacao]|uniref:Uncharacterized protein n=1 Tax=Theobroma cacao TaxID=3641 RepID=A0A061FPQ6_THECC|nr:Uncharacterized protein TCM_044325 [Theobroma cacao]
MFNEMALVVGKDMATGNLAKSFADIDFQTNTKADAMPIDLDKVVDKKMRESQSFLSMGTSLSQSRRKR